jgi:hypothetical protein
MSEFEPLNIAHYQQPTTPLSDGAAPYMDWIEVKRLVTDKTYQREISKAGSINVERIAEYFEWAKFRFYRSLGRGGEKSGRPFQA